MIKDKQTERVARASETSIQRKLALRVRGDLPVYDGRFLAQTLWNLESRAKPLQSRAFGLLTSREDFEKGSQEDQALGSSLVRPRRF